MLSFLLLHLCCATYSMPEPLPGDVVINEILFNPVKDGYDYVELYNRSLATVRLAELFVGKRDALGDLVSLKQVNDTAVLPPAAFAVVTANERWLRQSYRVGSSAVVCQVAGLASFPDDGGTIVLVAANGVVIDELRYAEKWHSPLISDGSGISLERMSYERSTQDSSNWASASTSSGYGTPGEENSQHQQRVSMRESVGVMPSIFSPDNDGTDDYAMISVNTKESGCFVNIYIYDVQGRRVRYLVRNAVAGRQNQYRWDGHDDLARRCSAGIYVVYAELFNLSGRVSGIKKVLVIGK